jgi:hypothetical protein
MVPARSSRSPRPRGWWIAVAGLVVLAVFVLAKLPPIIAYRYVQPGVEDDGFMWVLGELVVFAAFWQLPIRTSLGVRAGLVALACVLLFVPSMLGGLGHAPSYPRVQDDHASWLIAVFAWSIVVAVGAAISRARMRS